MFADKAVRYWPSFYVLSGRSFRSQITLPAHLREKNPRDFVFGTSDPIGISGIGGSLTGADSERGPGEVADGGAAAAIHSTLIGLSLVNF